MRRWIPPVLLVVGVLLAAAGVGLANRPVGGAAAFGWTAYSPPTSAVYTSADPGAFWLHGLGLALLALGAGTTGAAVTALVLRSTRRP